MKASGRLNPTRPSIKMSLILMTLATVDAGGCKDRARTYANEDDFWTTSCFMCQKFLFDNDAILLNIVTMATQFSEVERRFATTTTAITPTVLRSDFLQEYLVSKRSKRQTGVEMKLLFLTSVGVKDNVKTINTTPVHCQKTRKMNYLHNKLNSKINLKKTKIGARTIGKNFPKGSIRSKAFQEKSRKSWNQQLQSNAPAGPSHWLAYKRIRRSKKRRNVQKNKDAYELTNSTCLENCSEADAKSIKQNQSEGNKYDTINLPKQALLSFKILYRNMHVLITQSINKNNYPYKKIIPDANVKKFNSSSNYEEKENFIELLCELLELSRGRCDRWRMCCSHAHQCCQRMLLENKTRNNGRDERAGVDEGSYNGDGRNYSNEKQGSSFHENKKTEMQVAKALSHKVSSKKQSHINTHKDVSCATTWDGFACWDAEVEGVVAEQACPVFLGKISLFEVAKKECMEGGWRRIGDNEWTNYTACFNTQNDIIKTNVYIAVNCLSFLFLLPALIIFLSYRDLRKQARIMIHMHLFTSLLLLSIFNIIWYSVFHNDLFRTSSYKLTIAYLNPPWCRLLAMFKTHTTATSFAWTLCEAVFLHRLLSRSFSSHVSLWLLVLLGWVFPCIPTVVYYTFRFYWLNESCWSEQMGAFEWILYAPNLTCLLMNTILLGDILRILIFQMRSHPREPSSFRRGVKAALMLVPLFGLQLLLTIYRPKSPLQDHSIDAYHIITAIVTNSQGILVSLVYCYFNGEVIAHMRKGLRGPPVTTLMSMEDERKKSDAPSMKILEALNHAGALQMVEIKK